MVGLTLHDALAIIAAREDVIRLAYLAGMSKMEIHRRTGIARTTIDRILDR